MNNDEKRDEFAIPSKTTLCRGIGQINHFLPIIEHLQTNYVVYWTPQFIHPNIGICRDLMVTETDSFEFIEYFLLYDPSSLHVLFGIRCETDKMRSVERNRDESPHSKVDHSGVFVADVCSRSVWTSNLELNHKTSLEFYLQDQNAQEYEFVFVRNSFYTIQLV